VYALSEIGKEVLQRCVARKAFAWRLPGGTDCALTFDDGPHAIYTPRVLDLLALHGVKATFFVVGQAADREPELVRRMAREGHRVASHTYSHRDLPTLARAELREELGACRRLLRELTGVDTNLVRPPRGRVAAATVVHAMRWDYRLIHWSKTYSDYRQDGAGALLGRIRSIGLQPRDIALFHDNNPYTVEALGEMLAEWQASGRTFTTVA
jgi:peptidoglycan/xylan/chitin deacetylase (PgdA/CDA1 family)